MTDFSEANSMYLEHYQLAHDPFAERVPGFKFQQARRKQVLEQLVHFARYGNFLLMVTGPAGSGKTVLRQAMVAAARDTSVNVVISGQHCQDAAAVMHNIASSLKAPSVSVEGLLQAIEDIAITGSDVHILVDDAQVLDEAAMLLLQRLAMGNDKCRAAVYLFGTPALETLVQDIEQKNPEHSHHLITLEPWNRSEIENYLRARLQSAGRDLDIFTEPELELIVRDSGGWPGVINQLAREQLMARMFDRPQRRALPALPYKHMAALFVMVFLLVVIWYWQGDEQDSKQQVIALPAQVERPMIATERPAAPQQQQQQQQVQARQPVVEHVAEQPAPADEQSAPLPAPPAKVVPTPEAVATIESQPVARPSGEQQIASKQEPAKPPVAGQRRPRSWYHQQPQTNYTLQLMASSNVEAVRKYAQLDSDYHYFRKLHQGKYLYVLTYGSYASREQALAVQERLPAEFRSNRPWPRTFTSVVAEIR